LWFATFFLVRVFSRAGSKSASLGHGLPPESVRWRERLRRWSGGGGAAVRAEERCVRLCAGGGLRFVSTPYADAPRVHAPFCCCAGDCSRDVLLMWLVLAASNVPCVCACWVDTVILSDKFRGSRVECQGDTVSGVGAVLAEAPLHQDRVYWEVTVVDLPDGADFVVGVARKCVASLTRAQGPCSPPSPATSRGCSRLLSAFFKSNPRNNCLCIHS
jgi:hypothetical protein